AQCQVAAALAAGCPCGQPGRSKRRLYQKLHASTAQREMPNQVRHDKNPSPLPSPPIPCGVFDLKGEGGRTQNSRYGSDYTCLKSTGGYFVSASSLMSAPQPEPSGGLHWPSLITSGFVRISL